MNHKINWKGLFWVKCVDTFLLLLSGLLIIAGSLGVIFFAAIRNEEAPSLSASVYNRISDQYATAFLVDHIINQEGLSQEDYSALEGGPFKYVLTKEKMDGTGSEYVLYGDENILSDYSTCSILGDGYYCGYNLSSLTAAIMDPTYYYDGSVDQYQYSLSGIYQNEEDGIFYAKYEDLGYVMLDTVNIEFYDEDGTYIRTETYTYDEVTGYCSDDNSVFDLFKLEEGLDTDDSYSEFCLSFPYFSDNNAYVYYTVDGYSTNIEFSTFYPAPTEDEMIDVAAYTFDNDNWTIFNDSFYEGRYLYRVYLKWDESLIASSSDTFFDGYSNLYKEASYWLTFITAFEKWDVALVIIGTILFFITISILGIMVGNRKDDDEIHLRWYDKIPYSVSICICGGIEFGLGAGEIGFGYLFANGLLSISEIILLSILMYTLATLIFIEMIMTTTVRLKAHKFWRYTICYYISRPFAAAHRYLAGHMGFFWEVLVGLIGVSIIELIVICVTRYHLGIEVLLFFIFKLVEIPLVLWFAAQNKALFIGGERVAKGDYSQPINTKGMLFSFKKHGENINHVGDGISLAVEERMKSERFQTELITNVSHDIKTPLTSIINYVDLIEKLDIDDPTMAEYVEVLDRQSKRLKVLIEDLIEASKASSGALNLNMESIDAVVMLDQVIGEFGEKLEAQGLTIVVNKPELPINVIADGRHFWRILENLTGNIVKYAQPGTRVYVDLASENGWAHMTFRNISKQQLNIAPEELLGRFVRGDASRNTDGNGLGLNIASSLATLMGGNLAVQIDGDLFKVNLYFPIVASTQENC